MPQVGVYSAMVLVVLLMAVPIQLLCSHFLGKADKDGNDPRALAMASFSETVSSFTGSLQSALKHYSSWKNLRELFIIPHKHITHPNKKSGGGNSKAKTSTSTKTQKTQNDANLNPTSGGGGSSKSDVKESNKAPKVVNSSPPVNEGTSPAIEVENYMMTHVYFAQSEEPRVPKPTHVSYSVGQVVYHTQGGYWGVIVGWDKVAKASDEWIQQYYSKRKHVKDQPHYLVLVDAIFEDVDSTPYRYLPQEDISPAEGSEEVDAPEMEEFFEASTRKKEGRYTPLPWLQKRYPDD